MNLIKKLNEVKIFYLVKNNIDILISKNTIAINKLRKELKSSGIIFLNVINSKENNEIFNIIVKTKENTFILNYNKFFPDSLYIKGAKRNVVFEND